MRKYPMSLFLIGFITNIIFHFFWLFLPGVILIIAGIFIRPCLLAGLAVFLIDIIVSFIEQMRIRSACLKDSDHPDFRKFQEALSKDGSWIENVQEFVDSKRQS